VKIEVRFDPSSQPVVIQGSRVLVGALVHAIERAVSMPDGGEIQVRTGGVNDRAAISMEDAGTAPARDSQSARLGSGSASASGRDSVSLAGLGS
jgi:hypothetical protein